MAEFAAPPGPQRVLLVDPGHHVPDYDRFLAEALARAGWRVTFAAAPLLADAALAPEGVEALTAFAPWLEGTGPFARLLRSRPPPRRLARLLAYPLELAALRRLDARRGPGAVFHQQWSLAPLIDAVAFAAARTRGRVAVYTAHNILPHERHAGQTLAWRRLYQCAGAVIVHSEVSRRRLADLLGAAAPPATVVPMPADPPSPQPDRAAARRSLGIAPAVPLALFLGHVRPYKGLDLLLTAWPTVRARLPGARLMVRGAVAGGAGALEDWRRRVDRAGGAAAVDFVNGYLPRAERELALAAADLVVLPYRDIDMSAVLAAARGRGRAVVATAVGGLPEALAAGGGLLVPPLDVAALAAGVAGLLADAVWRRRLEVEALSAAAAWTWDDAAGATVAVYRQVQAPSASTAVGRR